MSSFSVTAIGGGPYTAQATTRSTTQLASGATVTTVRAPSGAVLAVTTAVMAAHNTGAQPDTSTFYVTA